MSAICEKSSEQYFARIAECFECGRSVFLLNPTWTAEQRAEAERLISRYREKTAAENSARIFVASGGSGGKIRFIAHTPETLAASARALIRILEIPEEKKLCCFACLPPWHISGLMPWVRSRISGGRLFVAASGSFHGPDDLPDFRKSPEEFWMNSLVPTQLRRILEISGGAEWLRGFDFILLGGAAVPADLIARAKAENLKIGIGYGMTETASLVALWRPGDPESPIAGKILPHAEITVSAQDSRIRIAADSLGETLSDDGELLPNPNGEFLTNDEGRSDAEGRLCVLGRADRYINSGGEKIDPALVESALRKLGVDSVLVVGVPDPEWGEKVVALVVGGVSEEVCSNLKKLLPAWMVPKRILSVPALPFDAKGKLDRRALAALVSEI